MALFVQRGLARTVIGFYDPFCGVRLVVRITAMQTLGIIGLGAFGRLMITHLAPYARVVGWDASAKARKRARALFAVETPSLEEVGACDMVVLATPVQTLAGVAEAVAPHVRPGALVMDVASVKMMPAQVLAEVMPEHAQVLATHPMFGPQSAAHGVAGHEIVLCPVRGEAWRRVARFLRTRLKLSVSVTTPERHDEDVAAVQGLTHLIAKVITRMGPMPERHRTESFSLLMRATQLVAGDSDALFRAIQQLNPHAPELSDRFFRLGDALREELAQERLGGVSSHHSGNGRDCSS